MKVVPRKWDHSMQRAGGHPENVRFFVNLYVSDVSDVVIVQGQFLGSPLDDVTVLLNNILEFNAGFLDSGDVVVLHAILASAFSDVLHRVLNVVLGDCDRYSLLPLSNIVDYDLGRIVLHGRHIILDWVNNNHIIGRRASLALQILQVFADSATASLKSSLASESS